MQCENEQHVGALPEELRAFLNKLVVTFPDITEIWLFGLRADRIRDARDWDLMVYSKPSV